MSLSLKYLTGGEVSYPPGAKLQPRTMVDFEFVWIQKGNVVYHLGENKFEAPAGSIILSQPEFVEGYTWDPAGPTRHAFFHFSPTDLPKDWPVLKKWPVVKAMPENDVVRPLFEFVVRNLGSGRIATPDKTLTRAVETMLSAFLLGPISATTRASRDYPEPVHRALSWIQATLLKDASQEITLDSLADACSVTGKHLCRVFSDTLKTTPMEVVMTLRLRRVAQLLARTDLKLETIARDCGFATPFHLSRRFKQQYHMSPITFRAQCNTGRSPAEIPLRLGDAMALSY